MKGCIVFVSSEQPFSFRHLHETMEDVFRQINGQSAPWQHCGWLVPQFLGQIFDEELEPYVVHNIVEELLVHFGVNIIGACS